MPWQDFRLRNQLQLCKMNVETASCHLPAELRNAQQGIKLTAIQWQQLPPTCSTVASAPSASVSAPKYHSNFSPLVVSRAQKVPGPVHWSPTLLILDTACSSQGPNSSSHLPHLYRAPGCNFRYPSVLNLVDLSQIWTLPLESTLSQKGKGCCFCPEGVLSTPLLSPSSVFWNFLECQTATPL